MQKCQKLGAEYGLKLNVPHGVNGESFEAPNIVPTGWPGPPLYGRHRSDSDVLYVLLPRRRGRSSLVLIPSILPGDMLNCMLTQCRRHLSGMTELIPSGGGDRDGVVPGGPPWCCALLVYSPVG